MQTRAERRYDHKSRMEWKAEQRLRWYEGNGNQPFPETVVKMRRRGLIDQYTVRVPNFPASVNRRTGEPHEHRREIARRLARQPELNTQPCRWRAP